ncbi:MAG: glycosyltransferase family 2 protein [Cellvibrio sp.]|nr:glycosyltransferase family 2 protein [Cellvibrio sp.]
MFAKVDTVPAISVIVPVYNVQDYLAECLDSLAQQEFCESFEIILIDDCSTDSSKKLCEEFVVTHPTIAKLICHSHNQGLSVVRNTGIAAATGDYFTFVDSDDVIPRNALQDLYDAAIRYQADIVKGNNLIFDEKGARPANYNVNKIKIYENDNILSVFLQHREIRGHTWGKLFRRTAFLHIKNTPGVMMAQDALYCAEIFSCAKKLVIINNTVYHYRLRRSGATGRKFQTGAYLWWLYSIENCGKFVTTQHQKTHLKELQIHTLLQIVREARSLNNPTLMEVLKHIADKQHAWQLTSLKELIQCNVGAKFLLKFIRFKIVLSKLKQSAKEQLHTDTTVK